MTRLTVLGNRVEGSLTADQLETFPAKETVCVVTFLTKEVTALCPVTNQPDLYTVAITYYPTGEVVESKTLKLYLTQWRNTGIFGEDLAHTIVSDLSRVLKCRVNVVVQQQVRGGMAMTVEADMDTP